MKPEGNSHEQRQAKHQKHRAETPDFSVQETGHLLPACYRNACVPPARCIVAWFGYAFQEGFHGGLAVRILLGTMSTTLLHRHCVEPTSVCCTDACCTPSEGLPPLAAATLHI